MRRRLNSLWAKATQQLAPLGGQIHQKEVQLDPPASLLQKFDVFALLNCFCNYWFKFACKKNIKNEYLFWIFSLRSWNGPLGWRPLPKKLSCNFNFGINFRKILMYYYGFKIPYLDGSCFQGWEEFPSALCLQMNIWGDYPCCLGDRNCFSVMTSCLPHNCP